MLQRNEKGGILVDTTNATAVPWGSDDDAIDSLEALIAEIKRKPSKPENIHYGICYSIHHRGIYPQLS